MLLVGENEDRKSWISSYSNCPKESSAWGRGWTQCQTKPWIQSPAPLFKKVLLNESGQRAEGHLVVISERQYLGPPRPSHPELVRGNSGTYELLFQVTPQHTELEKQCFGLSVYLQSSLDSVMFPLTARYLES